MSKRSAPFAIALVCPHPSVVVASDTVAVRYRTRVVCCLHDAFIPKDQELVDDVGRNPGAGAPRRVTQERIVLIDRRPRTSAVSGEAKARRTRANRHSMAAAMRRTIELIASRPAVRRRRIFISNLRVGVSEGSRVADSEPSLQSYAQSETLRTAYVYGLSLAASRLPSLISFDASGSVAFPSARRRSARSAQ